MTQLLAAGFRPFFLLAAAHALVLIPVWVGVWLGALAAPRWGSPLGWHAHEMLFGFVAAAAAGFLLTSVPVWTASSPLRGAPLAVLVGLWIAGRCVFALTALLPPLAVGWVDALFLPALAGVLGRRLLRRTQRRNQGILAVIVLWSLVNATWHYAVITGSPDLARTLAGVAMHCMLVILVVIGGRIVPLFTARFLERRGQALRLHRSRALDASSIAAVVALLAVDAARVAGLAPPTALGAGVPALAAVLLGVRWLTWRGDATLSDPLVWSLHLGFAWVPVGLALESASYLDLGVAPAAWLHALGIGAFGGMVLAVMSRVALGHTGRALRAPSAMRWAYLAVAAAALLRILGALEPTLARETVLAAAVLWALAQLVFLVCYGPVLCAPRVDGKPG